MSKKAIKTQSLDYIDKNVIAKDGEHDHFYGEIARGSLRKTSEVMYGQALKILCENYYIYYKE